MDAISPIQNNLSATELDMERTVRTLSVVKDAMEMEGEMALQLLESAVIDPDVGQQLNIQV